MKKIAKNILESLLDRYGYELKQKTAPLLGLSGYVQGLRAEGFYPATVIDIGVGHGTPWLYNAFPKSHFELFEPLEVFLPSMEEICRQFDAKYHITALGAKTGQTEIEVNIETPTSSTMSGFSTEDSPIIKSGRTVTIERRSIPIHRLDEYGPFKGPLLLKIDVEGFEMDVLNGAAATLSQADIIISEVSVKRRHKRDVSFGSFIQYMESLGFALVCIPEMVHLPRGGALSYIDAAFVRS